MIKLKHTPSPWYYQEESDAYTHIVRYGDDNWMCSTSQNSSGVSEANARLIAAAPEMLDNYITLYKWCCKTELDISLVMMSDIADIIQKATGQKIEDILKEG